MYADRKAPYPETITAPLISLRSRCHWSRSHYVVYGPISRLGRGRFVVALFFPSRPQIEAFPPNTLVLVKSPLPTISLRRFLPKNRKKVTVIDIFAVRNSNLRIHCGLQKKTIRQKSREKDLPMRERGSKANAYAGRTIEKERKGRRKRDAWRETTNWYGGS